MEIMMAKKSRVVPGLSTQAIELVKNVGENLKISRLRRGISQKLHAERMMVSLQTLQRIEKGDPTVSFAAYLACAERLNRLSELKDMLSLQNDVYGNLLESRRRMLQRKARNPDSEDIIFSQPDF